MMGGCDRRSAHDDRNDRRTSLTKPVSHWGPVSISTPVLTAFSGARAAVVLPEGWGKGSFPRAAVLSLGAARDDGSIAPLGKVGAVAIAGL